LPQTIREYLYAFLMLGVATFLIVGVFVFYVATSVEAYVGALVMFGAGGLAFLGARKMKGVRADEDLRALADHIGGKR
jgi:thiol:disulfide interchange protein